jgi:predicted short-subunit dehydrogenase-like oxidoreductase (DUF2520 family)
MRIVLIGAGNVATSIGGALKAAGHDISVLYSRTEKSAKELSDKLKVPYTTYLNELPHDADIYISMLNDDALIQLAPDIVALNRKALFVHTAGSLPLSLWKNSGAENFGVLYPMQTFSKTKRLDLQNVPLFVEGSSEQVLQGMIHLAKSLSPKVNELDSKCRKRLHIAAVFACNFTNRMYAISKILLEESGVDFKVMLPLIEETAKKIFTLSPSQAQTGPAIRGDVSVMDSHLESLKSHPDFAEIYKLISDNILKSIIK